MPSGTAENHMIAPGSDTRRHDARRVRAINGEEGRDLSGIGAPLEEGLHPAQVADAFLPDITDDQEIGVGLHPGRVQGADPCQQGGQGPGVIANSGGGQPPALPTDLNIGPFRKDGIKVGRYRHEGALTPGLQARTDPRDIALRIHLHIYQPQGFEVALVGGGSTGLSEGRRWNLGQADNVLHRPRVLCGQHTDGFPIPRAVLDSRHLGLRSRCLGEGKGHGEGHGCAGDQGQTHRELLWRRAVLTRMVHAGKRVVGLISSKP